MSEWILAFLGISALLLSIINGLFLLWNYLRDRPKLFVKPVHPEIYQWYFELPPGKFEEHLTRKYGFLAYFDVYNKGLRNVTIESWDLYLDTLSGDSVIRHPISIIDPEIKLGDMGSKKYHVFGATQDMMIQSGDFIAGFAYYIAEFYGNANEYGPLVKNEITSGEIIVNSVFGNKAKSRITFKKIPLSQAQELIPDIETIDRKQFSRNLSN